VKKQQVRIERISQAALTVCGREQKDRSCDSTPSSLFPHVWLNLAANEPIERKPCVLAVLQIAEKPSPGFAIKILRNI